ncbi:MAG: hypothetical protein RSB41_00350 [Bacilli bacterium]
MKKICSFIVLGILIMFGGISNLKASSASINISSTNYRPVVGNSITVSVKVSSSSALGTYEYKLSYDNNKLKLTSGSEYNVWYPSNSSTYSSVKSFTFKVLASGTSSVNVSASDVLDYSTEAHMGINVSPASIKASTQQEIEASYSKNNNLSTLVVENYLINPVFNKDTLEYNVSLPSNQTKINISGSVEDSTARIDGLGEKDVNEGNNKFEIKVTAQNGNVKTYIINANVVDDKPINIKINNKNLTVVKRESSLTKPDTFELTKVTIDGTEVPAFTSKILNITLVGLKDEDGVIKLYVYNEKDNSYKGYKEVKFNSLVVFPQDKSINLKNYTKYNIKINEEFVDVYKKNKSDKFSLFYAINIESGKEMLYQFDEEENTISRYNIEDIKDINKKNENYLFIIYVLLGESLLLVLILIILITKKSKKDKSKKVRIEKINDGNTKDKKKSTKDKLNEL